MIDRLPHQILHPDQQTKLDKEKIERMLREHNLDENIDLVFELVKSCANGRQIDECIEQILSEFNNSEEENNNFVGKYIKKYEN